MTRRSSSTTMREVPGAPRPMNEPPALPPVSTSTQRTFRPASCARAQREPDRAHLRVGEDHARRARAVRAQPDGVAEDRVGGEPALVLAHVRQQRAAVGVADGVQPVVAGHPQVVADGERLAGLEAEHLEADARRCRACGRPRRAAPRPRRWCRRPARARSRRARETRRARGAETHVDAEGAQRLEHLLARERLLALDQAVPAVDQRDGRVRARPRPAPSRRRRCRRRGWRAAAARSCAVVASLFVHGRDSRRPGMSGTSADEPVATTTARRAESDSWPSTSTVEAPGDLRPAADQRHAVLLEPRHLRAVVAVVDHLVAPPQHGRAVDRRGPQAGHASDLARQLDRPQQRLRRHAGVERAVAADERALDDRDREPVLAQPARHHLAGRRRHRSPQRRIRACAACRRTARMLRAEVGEHREHAAVLVGRGRQPELAEDAVDVRVDRLLAEEEAPADRGVRMALGDQAEQLALARRQLRQPVVGRCGDPSAAARPRGRSPSRRGRRARPRRGSRRSRARDP